jgi:hypothetical protein
MIGLQVNAKAAHARLSAVFHAIKNPDGLLAVLGRDLRNQLVTHFRARQQSNPNKLGGKRTNFWLQIARSVQSPAVEGDHVRVSINDPRIAQKVYGGTIRAKRAKSLTIPVAPEAYGRTAATLEHELGIKLFVMPSDFGQGLLAATISKGKGKNAKNTIKVFYVLRGSVHQDPDPEALPDRGKILVKLADRAEGYLQRILSRPSPA